jgi:phage-related protein
MMRWTVETFSSAVDAEIEALPKDMRARLVRLAETIEQLGFEALPFTAVKHLEEKLWELRISGRDGISRAIYIGGWPSGGDPAGFPEKVAENPATRD